MLRRFVFFSVIFLHLLLVDQFTKEWAVQALKPRPANDYSVEVVKGFFSLTYVENRGCAWGMFQGQVWPLAAFGIAAMALLIWKRKSVFPEGGWGKVSEHLLYAGIAGNAIDRVTRGCVVDMFDFYWGVHHFPVFNVADSYITVAAAILVAAGFFEKKKTEGARAGGERAGE